MILVGAVCRRRRPGRVASSRQRRTGWPSACVPSATAEAVGGMARSASAARWRSGRQCDRRLPEPSDVSRWAAANNRPDLVGLLDVGAAEDFAGAVAAGALAGEAAGVDPPAGGFGVGVGGRLGPVAAVAD